MAKSRASVYFCQNCGYESSKWMGQCPGCREWNTFVEEKAPELPGGSHAGADPKVRPVKLGDIEIREEDRISTGMKELDRVLGGGIVPGSLVLVAATRASANPPCFCRCAAIFLIKKERSSIFPVRNR